MKSIKSFAAKGFTLIELIISVAIGMGLIGILCLVLLFALWGTSDTDIAQSTIAAETFAENFNHVEVVSCAGVVNDHGNVWCAIFMEGEATQLIECTESGCFVSQRAISE